MARLRGSPEAMKALAGLETVETGGQIIDVEVPAVEGFEKTS
jgi:hypothetical protein